MGDTQKIRILIADDHAVLRVGLRMVISSQVDMDVVGEASNGESVVAEAKRLRPDVVMLDLTMGAYSGSAAIMDLRKAAPESRILVLTMHTDTEYLRTALASGAMGYVIKNSADSEVLMAIREVAQGRRFVDHALDIPIELPSPRKQPTSNPEVASLRKLSQREREVLGLIAHGFTNQQVAEQLRLSVKSVETYRSRFMDKLALSNRADMVKFALQSGVLTATS